MRRAAPQNDYGLSAVGSVRTLKIEAGAAASGAFVGALP